MQKRWVFHYKRIPFQWTLVDNNIRSIIKRIVKLINYLVELDIRE